MARADREPVAMYAVWRSDLGETADDSRSYGALDISHAAAAHAAYIHRHRSGNEWSWPVVFDVRDPNGRHWVVEVERELVPEFHGGTPLAAEMAPALHVYWGRAICDDPRLRSAWPDGQHFTVPFEIFSGAIKLEDVTCERCRKLAPALVASLESIGALKSG